MAAQVQVKTQDDVEIPVRKTKFTSTEEAMRTLEALRAETQASAIVEMSMDEVDTEIATYGHERRARDIEADDLGENLAKLCGCLKGVDQIDTAGDERLEYLLKKHG